MIIYELLHLFFRHEGDLIMSPKSLGLFYTKNSVSEAIRYFNSQPGFQQNKEAYSIQEKYVHGTILDDTVYHTIVYFHTKDYEYEYDIDLGMYTNKDDASDALKRYCADNSKLLKTTDLVVEKIINKCIVGRYNWPEGFTVTD